VNENTTKKLELNVVQHSIEDDEMVGILTETHKVDFATNQSATSDYNNNMKKKTKYDNSDNAHITSTLELDDDDSWILSAIEDAKRIEKQKIQQTKSKQNFSLSYLAPTLYDRILHSLIEDKETSIGEAWNQFISDETLRLNQMEVNGFIISMKTRK
jgi:hypothetical protein